MAKYDRLKKNYEDPTFEVVSSVFRALSGKKIVGAGSFTSHAGHPGIKANLKAVQGDLFFLEKYVFFVSKQPTLIELSDIHQVVFSRLGAGLGATAARTFDLKIVTKSGPEYTFTSINKEEHEGTETYLKEKKVKVKNEMMEGELILAGEDDEDEEMQSVASSGEEVPKPRGINDDDDSEDGEVSSRSLPTVRVSDPLFSQTRTSRRPIQTPARRQRSRQTTTVRGLPRMRVAIATSSRRARQRQARRRHPRRRARPRKATRRTTSPKRLRRGPSPNQRRRTMTTRWTWTRRRRRNRSQSQSQSQSSRQTRKGPRGRR